MMSRFRLPCWAPRLLWKLAGAYLLTTIATVSVYVLIDVELDYRRFQSGLEVSQLAARAQEQTARIAPLLAGQPLNPTALDHLTARLKYELEDRRKGLFASYYFGLSDFTPEALSLHLADAQAQLLARAGTGHDDPASAAVRARLVAVALHTESEASRLAYQDGSGLRAVAAPIIGHDQRRLGAVVLMLRLPDRWWQGMPVEVILGELRMLDGIAIALVSLLFGVVLARRLTTRLERISTAADAWSQGDFTARADDRSADELGVLSRRLNQMAQELRQVVALRQSLAASEERNRLARDLHDTVKQRAFALSMQIGAAQALLSPESQAARTRLAEAENLVWQIQQELVTIIQELRPAVSAGQGLAAALRNYVADWARQSGIQAEWRGAAPPELTPAAEEAFLRILQEALANIARHSRASSVVVQLSRSNGNDNDARLTVKDNGQGFDPQSMAAGMGLQNMRARAESLPGGWFNLDSQPGKGARLEAGCRTDNRNGGP